MNYSYLVVHHSATSTMASVDDIRQAHLNRGFDDIGYHYVIGPSGVIYPGRSESEEGAHAYGLNSESLGICCIGNFNDHEVPREQLAALVRLLRDLCVQFSISPFNIIAHCDVKEYASNATHTECPGSHLRSKLDEVRQRVSISLHDDEVTPRITVALDGSDVVLLSGTLSLRSVDKLYAGEAKNGTLMMSLAMCSSSGGGQADWESAVQLIRDPEGQELLLFSVYLPQNCLRPDYYYCEGRIGSGSTGLGSLLPLFRLPLRLPVILPFTYSVPPLRSRVDVARVESTGTYLVRLTGRVLNVGGLDWINSDERAPYRVGAMIVSAESKQPPFLELRYDIPNAKILVGDELPFSFTFDTSELPPGDFVGHVDVVKERYCWFSEVGGVGDAVPFSVQEKRPTGLLTSQSQLNPLPSGAMEAASCNFLYIAPTVPLFDRSTGGRRLVEMFKMLREEGVDVTFLYQQLGTFTEPGRYLAKLDEIGVRHAMDPLGYLSEYTGSKRFSLCVLGWYSLAASMLPAVRTLLPGVRIVVDSVDIHWAREASALATRVSTNTEAQCRLEKQRELFAYSEADEVWTVSTAEEAIVREELPTTKTRVVGIPCEKAAGYLKQVEGRKVLFFGGFAHPPNISAAVWAADIITEYNATNSPPLQLVIAGADPPPEVLDLAKQENVSVTGYVASLEQLYSTVAVMLCPLRAGGGVKGKICEAIAYGVPVITNRLGNEGLGLEHAKEIVLAETTADFIACLHQYFAGVYARDGLRESALKVLLTSYGREAVKRQLLSAAIMRHVLVAIVTFNKRDLLRVCLYSILEKTSYPSFTVAVVSNGCTDGTIELVKELEGRFPGKIKLYPSEQNHFFVRPNNYLIREYPDSDVVLVNNDVEVVNSGWLTNLVDAAYSASDVCGSGGLVLDAEGKVSEAGAEIYGSGSGINLCRGSDPDGGSVQMLRSVGFVSGCLMYMRRDAINLIGPLDEDFHPMYYEDAAWHYKAHVHGLRTVYTPWSVVVHKEGSTAGVDISKGMKRYQTINREKFLAKFEGVDIERFNSQKL